MLKEFLNKAEEIVSQHKMQYRNVYYMKGGVSGAINKVVDKVKDNWVGVRDAAETGAVLGGNYLLPGSSLLTSNLASQGSQKQLSSPLGTVAQIGTGLAGAGVGSSLTGIPSAAAVGAGWGNLASGVGNALGITNSAATAAPWVNPDLAVTGSEASGVAAPWVNPDAVAVTPGASASVAAPWVNPDLVTDTATTAATGAAGANPYNLTAGDANFLSKAGLAYDAVGNPINTGTSMSSAVTPAASAPSGNSAGGLLKSIAPWVGPAISGTGLAMSALKGSTPLPAEAALKTQAEQAAQQGTTLQSYLGSGKLPAGAQASIDQAKNAAKAAIRSKYASMGMSGSTSEQQELAAADANAQTQGTDIALKLLDAGVQESSLSSEIYKSILNNTLQQDQNLSSAIGNFASSIGNSIKG